MVRDSALAPDVSQHHRRVDADEYGSVYVVGDVHGCIAELRALWDRLEPDESDLVVFVGDLVSKGPAPVDVVDFVRRKRQAMSVRGNAERNLLRGDWPAELPPRLRETLGSLPLVISWTGAMVVHGGVSPNRPLAAHTAADLVETRSIPPENGYDGPFWFEGYEGPPAVLFGHTVCTEPVVREWAIGLDTGCVHGGALTAYDVTDGEFVSVPAERTYRSRSPDRVLDPESL